MGSVFYGPIIATFIAAVAIRQINARGVNIGIISGVAVNVYLWLFVPEVFWFWWNAVGAVVTIIAGLIASALLGDSEKEVKITKMDFAEHWDRSKAAILVAFFVAIVIFSYFVDQMI